MTRLVILGCGTLSVMLSPAGALTSSKQYVDFPKFCDNLDTHCCNPWRPLAPTGKTDPEPRMIWSHACAGSSTVLDWTNGLMELSDTPSLNCLRGYEVLADFANGFYPGVTDAGEGLLELVNASAKSRRALLFKAEMHNVQDQLRVREVLKAIQPRTVFLERWNVLDTLICSVRDRFKEMTRDPGYTLDPNGEKSDRWRGRPDEELERPPVYLNASTFLFNIDVIQSYNNDNYQYLVDMKLSKYPPVMFSTEELFAFEGDNVDIDQSALAWVRFLKVLGVHVELDVVRSFLKDNRKLSLPQRHSDVISNFDEIRMLIENCSDEDWCIAVKGMLRV